MNLKRIVLIIAGISILTYIIYAGISCIFTTEEDRIRAVLEECMEIIESGSRPRSVFITDHLTKDFTCSAGANRGQTPGLINVAWERGGKPTLVITGLDINISGETAIAEFRLDANFPKEGWLKGDHAYQMKTGFRKIEGEWKISSAEWEQLKGPDTSTPGW
ncbi:MAG: hypothetical protein E3J72_10940 [Planctomycetota bacterium]|nr:MAG: hypothetical protein E3J72_10940 [Planctomycetota bacterium]